MILDKVRVTIRSYALLRRKDSLLLAVSGGPDSLAMLYCLRELAKEYRLRLSVAHFDHMLRRGSAREAEFVSKAAQKLQIPFYRGSADVRVLRGHKGSLEEAAREARLKFLSGLAQKIKADKVALGHNMDDQAETVLMRVLRGTGLSGLAGISARKQISGCVFIRPLLEVSRKEIESYLRAKKVKAFRDPSNNSLAFTRNKLRHKLIPLLEKEYNPALKGVLSSLAENAACDYDYILSRARRIMLRSGQQVKIQPFLKLHPSLRRMFLRLRIEELQGSKRRITFQHIREIEDMLLNRPTGSVVDLPKGISAVKKGGSFRLYKR